MGRNKQNINRNCQELWWDIINNSKFKISETGKNQTIKNQNEVACMYSLFHY